MKRFGLFIRVFVCATALWVVLVYEYQTMGEVSRSTNNSDYQSDEKAIYIVKEKKKTDILETFRTELFWKRNINITKPKSKRELKQQYLKKMQEERKKSKEHYKDISGGGQSKGNGTIKRLPVAIVIGVKKCGTTALRIMLDKHPTIVASKELHFFSAEKHFGQGYEHYRNMMPPSLPDQIPLEKSPFYFPHPKVPNRIKHFNSSIQLVLVVRDPVERVVADYSFYIYNTKKAIRPSLEELLTDPKYEKMLTRTMEDSYFGKHYSRWLRYFPRSQIHIVDGNKLKEENPAGELSKLESYLGAPHYYKESMFELDDNQQFYCFVGHGDKECFVLYRGGKHPNITETTLDKVRDLLRKDTMMFLDLSEKRFNWKMSKIEEYSYSPLTF